MYSGDRISILTFIEFQYCIHAFSNIRNELKGTIKTAFWKHLIWTFKIQSDPVYDSASFPVKRTMKMTCAQKMKMTLLSDQRKTIRTKIPWKVNENKNSIPPGACKTIRDILHWWFCEINKQTQWRFLVLVCEWRKKNVVVWDGSAVMVIGELLWLAGSRQ